MCRPETAFAEGTNVCDRLLVSVCREQKLSHSKLHGKAMCNYYNDGNNLMI